MCNFRDDSGDWSTQGDDYAGNEAYMQIVQSGLKPRSHQNKSTVCTRVTHIDNNKKKTSGLSTLSPI